MKNIFISLGLIFLCASCTPQKGRQTHYPVLLHETIGTVKSLSDREALMAFLQENGIKRATLVKVSAALEMSLFSAREAPTALNENERIMEAYRPPMLRRTGVIAEAIQKGYIERIYWVIPFRLLEFSDVERRVRMLLKLQVPAVSERDLQTFTYDGRCMNGVIRGTELFICSPESLPGIQDPVVLDIDAHSVILYAGEQSFTNLKSMRQLLAILGSKKLQVRAAAVSLSLWNTVRPYHAYIAGQIFDVIKNPEVLKSAQPPDLWAAYDSADAMISRGECGEAAAFTKNLENKHPGDKGLMLLHAASRNDCAAADRKHSQLH